MRVRQREEGENKLSPRMKIALCCFLKHGAAFNNIFITAICYRDPGVSWVTEVRDSGGKSEGRELSGGRQT